jgi:hypothetical protein
VLTFEEYLARHTPRDRAYSVVDLREGWEACLRELVIREWEFRVILPPTKDDSYRRGNWHVIPFVCIKPMLLLFAHEIELRPLYAARGEILSGLDAVSRLTYDPEGIPF